MIVFKTNNNDDYFCFKSSHQLEKMEINYTTPQMKYYYSHVAEELPHLHPKYPRVGRLPLLNRIKMYRLATYLNLARE